MVDTLLAFLIGIQCYLIGNMLDRRAGPTLFAGLSATSAILITVFGTIAAFPFVHAMVTRMFLEPRKSSCSRNSGIIGGLLALLTWLAWGLLSFGKSFSHFCAHRCALSRIASAPDPLETHLIPCTSSPFYDH